MLTHEEVEAILERKRAGSATEADLADLRRSLKLEGEIVQIGLQQGQYNVNIGKVAGQDIQFGDRIYYGADAEAIREMLREVLGLSGLLPPSLEQQQEAVRQFLRSTCERFSSVEFLHRRGEKVALRDQYIPIQVTLDKQPEKSSAGRYLGYVESEAELQRAYALKKEDDQREQIDWQEARKKHQRIIVLADPGMGKTTLLRIEAGTLAEQEQQALDNGSKTLETVIFPVWLRLSNLAEQVQQATDTVLEAILKLVKAELDDRHFARLQPSLKDKLEKGQCLLLLDALDEVPRQLRDRLSERLEVFALNCPCPIICTSRIVGYASLLKGATAVEIVPFRQEQTEIYIEKWFTNAADTLNKTGDETVSAKKLIQELKSRPQIQGLATNPLMLSLICSLYQEKGITLPARRCQVYAKAVEYMLGKWCTDNQRKAQDPAWVDAKTELLEALAYQFTCENKELFDLRELRKKIDQYKKSDAASSDFEGINASDLITELTEQDGILQRLSEKDYLFFHRTFQEYFTASYLVRAGEAGIALAKAHLWNFEWHETISLMAGLVEDPLKLIQEILNEKDDIFHTQLLLAGRCLLECAESENLLKTETFEGTVHNIYQFWCRYPAANFTRSIIFDFARLNLIGQLNNFQIFFQHEDRDVRQAAAKLLGEIGTTEVVPALIQALQDEDRGVRQAAAKALGEIGTTEVVPALIQALQDEDRDVRQAAAKALGEIGTTEVVPALIQALQDEDRGVRQAAAEALGNIGTTEVVPALIQALQDEHSYVRWVSAEALGNIGTTEAVSALVQVLQDEDCGVIPIRPLDPIELPPNIHQPEIRGKQYKRCVANNFQLDIGGTAAAALSNISTAEAALALTQALQHTVSRVRIAAAWALGNIGSTEAVPALTQALQDEDYRVRGAAAWALGNIGSTEAVPALTQALQDEDYRVRGAAAWALGEIGIPETVPALIQKLQNENKFVIWGVVWALGKIGTSETISILIQAIQDEDHDIRATAAWALGEIGSTEAVPALTQALQDEDRSVRETAAKLLTEIGTTEVVPALTQELQHTVSRVRIAAARALGEVGSIEAVPALTQALQDEDYRVREAAARALGEIGSTEAVPALIHVLQDEDYDEYEYYGVREAAACTLGSIGSTEAVPALIQALQDKDYRDREGVAEALGFIGSTEAVPALIQALQDKDGEVRWLSARALGLIGSTEAVPALIQVLQHRDHFLKSIAVNSLGAIGTTEAGSALIQALQDQTLQEERTISDAVLELITISFAHSDSVLEQLLQNPVLLINHPDIFLRARQLTIQNNRKGDHLPVYPEIFRNLM